MEILVELGRQYTDVVSGFTGKALSRCEHLFDATQVRLVSSTLGRDGQPVSEWITEGQLKEV